MAVSLDRPGSATFSRTVPPGGGGLKLARANPQAPAARTRLASAALRPTKAKRCRRTPAMESSRYSVVLCLVMWCVNRDKADLQTPQFYWKSVVSAITPACTAIQRWILWLVLVLACGVVSSL